MYLAKIEEYFSRYRRQGIILSPKNWLIAERWERMGIPIDIVCKGIKETCRRFRSTHREGEERIDILSYCEPEIMRLWKDKKKALLGAPMEENEDKGRPEVIDILRGRIRGIREDLTTFGDEADVWTGIRARAFSELNLPERLDLIEEEYCTGSEVVIEEIESQLRTLDKELMKRAESPIRRMLEISDNLGI